MCTPSRLAYFPVAWFAVVMGLAGFALAWGRAETVLPLSFVVSDYLLYTAAVVFCVLLIFYAAKLLHCRQEVIAELENPVKLNFFPTISIGLMLLGTGFLSEHPEPAKYAWMVGAATQLAFTLYVLSAWINHSTFEIAHINPAWFIPVVGNILVPVAGVQLFSVEISWFFFSIGLLFWIILVTIIFYRVIFHTPLPVRLVPTMFILIAPPAVGFISYTAIVGGFDNFARFLYYAALFLTLLLLSQFSRFFRLPFFLSWWAYSFPMAAITMATLLMYQYTHLAFFRGLSLALLTVLTLVLGVLVVKTIVAVKHKEICVKDG